jgi:AraC-like DNA-binding protein
MACAVDTGDRCVFEDSLALRDMRIDSFEQLRAATPTSSSDIVQVEAGRMRGRLKHATIAGLSLGFGSFSRGLISRGIYSNERVTIGFLFEGRLDREGASRLGVVRVWPPGMEHERRHFGGASFGAISASMADLSKFFGPDHRFSDPSSLRRCTSFRADAQTSAAAADGLRSIMASFEGRYERVTARHAEYWKRAILEAAAAAITSADTSEVFVASPVRLVRRAQEMIESSGSNPVHISELTTALHVPRRSMHRAFDEVLGISPMKYLRHRRLCEARILLKQDANATVADAAFVQGFSDFGRFSGYYRSLFGEYPSETLASARAHRVAST